MSGTIKSITDFGIFIGLEGGIDGLVHLSDISWHDDGDEAVRNYKKGDEVETAVLSIDSERERISLGIKQLSEDPFGDYVAQNEKGSIVKGKVTKVEEKLAVILLAESVEALLKSSEFSREKMMDLTTALKIDDEIEAKIISLDKKNRTISLSVKAKDLSEEKAAVKAHKDSESDTSESGAATIGDLIKAQMDK